jgi:hypothetical protein
MMSQLARLATQGGKALGDAARNTTAQTAVSDAAPALAEALLTRGPALGGLQQRRPISTVVDPTRMGTPDGPFKSPGHVQLLTTPAEQQKFGLAPAYGHSPVGPVTDKRPVSVPMVDAEGKAMLDAQGRQLHKTVQSGMAPAKPMAEDKPYPTNAPGIEVIDHGELSARQAAILKQEGGKFDPQYDLVGEKAANCVTAANTLHIRLGLTDVPLGPLATPQEAGALVRHSKTRDADTY